MANALKAETSPYLLQHAENPVDWLPWGEEALARSRELGRPMLVSIGYSACHWCHVMERECFEDPTIAALMNENFDCIKVDRSFVAGIGHDSQSTAIINAIAYLARGLGLTIVAEGVETDDQYKMLRLAGCSHMQGFLFGKAEPAGHFDSQPVLRLAAGLR